MSQNSLIHSTFAYNGHDFSMIGDSNAVLLAGNAIMLWDTASQQKDYIWSKRNGYCMVTSNYTTNMLAAAEYGLNPEVHIYKYPSKELVHKFGMDTTVKCIGMAFSRCGKFLLMVGGVPDFKISIFDIENNKKLVVPETKLPCKPEEFLQAQFNPQNKNEFAILSQSCLYTYNVFPAYDVTETGEQKILGESFRLEHTEYKDENPDLTFTKMIWDPYNRVHICTDMALLIQVDPKNSKLEYQLSLNARPVTCLLTQKHMVISTEDGQILWHTLELPEMVVGDRDPHESKLKVLDEIDQDFALNIKVGESDMPECISHMHYNKNFKFIAMGTETGVFGYLNVEAEAINYDEEDEENQKQKERKTLTEGFNEIGRFHTKNVNGIKELGETTQLVTISEDHYMSIWEATNQKLIATVYQPAVPTSLDCSVDGCSAFVGTIIGACRAYDLSDRTAPRLVMQQKFFDENIPISNIQCSADGKYTLISSMDSCNVFILSQVASEGFQVLGFIAFDAKVCSCNFVKNDGKSKIIAVLANNLLGVANVPTKPCANRMVTMPSEDSQIAYRKIDKGSALVIANEAMGDNIFVTGDDKLLKKYEFPTDKINQIDVKRAPPAPTEEHQSHSITTTCWDTTSQFKRIATGGKDGSIFLKALSNIGEEPQQIRAHALFSGGITALCFSKTRSILYTAGGDGSIMAWNHGGRPNPPQPVNSNDMNAAVKQLPELARVPGSQIKLFKQILREEFERKEKKAKEDFKESMVAELSKIKDKLLALLAENDRVTDIEKLERDEFVIDVTRKTKVMTEGEKECEDIRKEAEKTVLRLELLRNRVKQSTWDTMEFQQKAVKSIQSDTLVFNYPIRNRELPELRRLGQVTQMRRIELKERFARAEKDLKEGLDEAEFSKDVENYVMNRARGKPEFNEDGSIQEAALQFAIKDEQKKANKKKQGEQNLNLADASQGNKRVPILKITKGKLGTKTKKKDTEDDDGDANKGKMATREIKGMEEMHWKVYNVLQDFEKARDMLDKDIIPIFDLMYEPYELFTDVRKRNQIELIKQIVFDLKKDFNKEFFELEKYKEDQWFAIKEKNEQITEILENLKQTEELFEPKSHPLETPETILVVNEEEEIKVERYLTKEEKAVLEAERIKQQEREDALKGDNVGQRGLQTMMGGTEFNHKKDKASQDQELIREDWMNKSVDDMTDDEKAKLKEFEQKEKEFKEKQKKAWEQDLKKIKGEIIEIQLRFEERLLTLFKKKLFIDVRVLEQELYLIRLVIMLHDGKETRLDEKKYTDEMLKLESEKSTKETLISTFRGFAQNLEASLSDDTMIKDQERELKKMFPDVNFKQILSFVRQGKAKKAIIPGEENPREKELMQKIVELDPYSAVDKTIIKEILKEENEREEYSFERDNQIANLAEEDFGRLVQERYTRAEMDKDKTKLQNQIQQLQDHINYLETQYQDVEEQFEGQVVAQKKASDRIQKIRYNFEAIVYIKQGWVEVPQLPVATDYKDAILVSEDVIEIENAGIKKKGEDKVKLMNRISKFKTDLERVKYVKKRLDLEIKDFEERAKDVQLYRVTKQTQEIIQGKHQKKDEEDKKRLENQIKQLEENALKRIKTINETRGKLKHDIREKRMESDQLENKARTLQDNVDQRKQIMSLKSNTMNDGDADPSKKIKEIAHKRKLLDIAKQQSEEIEVLRDELDRLRARTFPSFAHLHNKPGYPDEN